MQLILPLPLFLPFERIIGVLIGPSSIQLLFDVDFKLIQKEVFWGEKLQNFSDKLLKPFTREELLSILLA